MKTKKKVVLSALVALFVSVSAFANEPVSSKLVVLNQKSGVYKVIYEGAKAGKVSMKITDVDGNELFTETINSVTGFSRPVNFEGMTPGVYTIEVSDESGKLAEKVDYKHEVTASAGNVYIARTSEAGKYIL